MKNLKSFLKDNKHTVIVLSCCLILTILVFIVKFVFFPNDGNAIYGDRLDGIEEVKIKDSKLEQIESTLKDKDEIENVTVSISGRILNVIITAKDDVSVDTAKTFTDKIDEALDEDQRKFYDIQVFVKKNNDDEKFPIIGYHHQNSDHYSWSKDR